MFPLAFSMYKVIGMAELHQLATSDELAKERRQATIVQ